MPSVLRQVLIFATFFSVFYLVGVLLDVSTGFKYGIRDSLTASAMQAKSMVGRWIGAGKKGWFWTPFLALTYILSPFLFVFAFLVAISDIVRADAVHWEDGKRTVYPGRTLTLDDISKNPKVSGRWFDFKLAGLLGDNDRSGVLYMGKPVPAGWTPENQIEEADRKAAVDLKFRRIGISGQYWYAPPADADQDISLADVLSNSIEG